MQPKQGDILIAGEMFRLRIHNDPTLIRDRRYHFRTYTGCYVGRELVDWMVSKREATSRDNAVRCLKLLQEHGILHHVCDDHLFKDEYLFYRFRIDDGTFFVEQELELYQQGIFIHSRILQSKDQVVLATNIVNGEEYDTTITRRNLINWIAKNKFAKDSTDAAQLIDQFATLGILMLVGTGMDLEERDDTVYQFVLDSKTNLPLYKALGLDYEDDDGREKLLQDAVQRLGLSPGAGTQGQGIFQRLWSGGSDVDSQDGDSLPNSPTFDGNANKLRPVVVRNVTAEELVSKNSPYVHRNVRVVSDAVGFGFVVRGDGPCYVQTVDPTGPAAAAGIKVRQYLYSVNGKKAIYMNHKDVAREIMKGPVVDLVVMQHFRSMSHE